MDVSTYWTIQFCLDNSIEWCISSLLRGLDKQRLDIPEIRDDSNNAAEASLALPRLGRKIVDA